MQSSNPRKRPAPGTTSQVQQAMPPQQPTYDFSQLTSDGYNDNSFNFNTDNFLAGDQTYGDSSLNDNNAFAEAMNGAQYPNTMYAGSMQAPSTSTDLVRRTPNQQLTRAAQQEQWSGYGAQPTQNDEDEDEQELEQRIAMAKRDTQGKRKQIPPFVQKLSR